MTGKRRSHSEQSWARLPDTIVRCNGTRPNGSRCKREAETGSVVCDVHGGAAPQTRRRAAERILLTADEAVQVILGIINDPTIPAGTRLRAAQDMADRAGLGAAQVVKVVPDSANDPVEALFQDLLNDPSNFDSQPPALPAAQPPVDVSAFEAAAATDAESDDDEDVVHLGVIVDNDADTDDPPPVMPTWLREDLERD